MLLAAAAGLTSVALSTTANAQDVTLRFAGTLPTTHHNAEGQYMFAEKVKEKTGGAVEVEVYPAGQLYKAREIPTAIGSGSIDMGFNLTSVWSTDPVSEITDIPFLFRDAAHAAKAWAPDGKLYQAFAAEMDKRGMKTVYVMFFGSLFDFGNNVRLLKNGEDFDGIKIRGYGKLAAEGLRALGASPVVMSPGEMYLAIQRGTIDGAITGVTSLESRKIWEVTDYATITGAAFGVMAVNISKASWGKLSPEQQAALTEAGTEVFEWSVEESERRDASSTQFLKDHGIETYVLTPEDKEKWKELFAPAYEAWKERANDEQEALVEWVGSL
ncbi:TRAP transporter substrate-binding protein [Acuticoccus kandeliae]|uniref:TRAP transporter substrate-binding protein n=1 Tax=Acuticoccus kandeliae TaxID=2073160 RepID=UPI0014765BFA|nr:TRAP transporter substrate-binding protein DctP [Acuticoccus kandeliae]